MNALLVFVLLATAPAAHPAVESDIPLPAALEQLGLYAGMDYAQVRRALLGNGWTAEPNEDEGSPSFAAFPEVECGQGWQPVCSASFRRRGSAVFLWMDPTDYGHLRLLGAE